MKKYIIIFLIILSGCKSFYELPKGKIKTKKLKTSRFELTYPEDWRVNNVKGYDHTKSMSISRFNKNSFKNVWFSIIIDVYKTYLKLKDLTDKFIEQDYILRTAKIITVKQNSSYLEFQYKYNHNKNLFKGITRFYDKNGRISQVSFRSKEKDFEDFSNYKKLFLGAFVLK